jgi:dienelactone hydrolase
MTFQEREVSRWLASCLLCLFCLGGTAFAGGSADVSITTGVAYGRKSELALTMDVYRPEHPNGSGVIFLMSGGWRSLLRYRQWVVDDGGSVRLATHDELRNRLPHLLSFSFRPLLERGITVFGVYHRNSPRFRMPDIVADVRSAVHFIRANAGEYDVDPQRLGLWGVSSGGQLALLLGTTGDPEAPDDPDASEGYAGASARVAAVVAYSAPTDLERTLHAPEPSNPALVLSDEEYQAFSPFRHVSSGVPPTLIVHGEADELVDVREGRTMYEALREQGVETRLVTIPGARHGFVDQAAQVALSDALQWFKRYLGVESP